MNTSIAVVIIFKLKNICFRTGIQIFTAALHVMITAHVQYIHVLVLLVG